MRKGLRKKFPVVLIVGAVSSESVCVFVYAQMHVFI